MSSPAQSHMSDCPQCGANNSSGKKFCGDCGASLDPLSGTINSYLEANLKSRVDEVIKDRFKDQKAMEVEVAAEIAEKLSGWAKLFGAFVALPMALILGIMGFYGFKELSDVHKAKDEIDNKIRESRQALDESARQIQVNTATTAEITTKVQSSKKGAEEAATQVQEFQRKVKEMSALLDQIPRLNNRVTDLEATVKDLNHPSSAIIMKNLRIERKVFGIDAAHFAGTIDWKRLKEAGVSFAAIKATEGTKFADPLFLGNWSQSKKIGILRSAYHYFHYNSDPLEQAEHFTKTFRQEPGDLPPAVDVERPVTENLQLSTPEDIKKVLDNLAIFIEAVRKNTGCNPIIITDSFWRRTFSPSASRSFSKNPLWFLRIGKAAQAPPPWTRWTFWQFSDSLQLNNLPAYDFNAFNGTHAELQNFIKQQCLQQ